MAFVCQVRSPVNVMLSALCSVVEQRRVNDREITVFEMHEVGDVCI